MDGFLKKVLIVGFGVTGQAVSRFLLDQGAEVIAVDQKISIFQNHPAYQEPKLTLVSEQEALAIEDIDLMILSPGIPPWHPLCQKAKASGIPAIGEIELALRYIKNPIIAITGTNGKTTTTLLITHILNSQGFKAVSLGNIGRPLIGEIQNLEKDAIIVLELSSFQIETLNSQAIDYAVLLNITPDHLDRYGSMEEYAKAKIKLEKALKQTGKFLCEKKCYEQYKGFFSLPPDFTYGYDRDCRIFTDCEDIIWDGKRYPLPESMKGRRSHDLENILAAWGVCHFFKITFKQFLKALENFKKPRHRIEFVGEIEGVKFFDDSKGTNLDAVIRAVEQFEQKIILIAGGVHKGASYECWLGPFLGKVKKICAIGQAAKLIKEELASFIPTDCFDTLEEAVLHAKAIAEKGEIVLLSPGCSSYDMFKDYAHRGEAFQKIVQEVLENCSFCMDIIKK